MRKLCIFLVISFLLLYPNSATPFDSKVGELPDLENNSSAYVFVTTKGEAEGVIYDSDKKLFVKKRGVFLLYGSGFIIRPGVVITALHVVKPQTVTICYSENHYIVVEAIKVLSRSVYISGSSNRNSTKDSFPAILEYEGTGRDIAVLSYDKDNYSIPKTIEIDLSFTSAPNYFTGGMMDLIFPGDVVGIVVHKRDEAGRMIDGIEIKYGKVISGRALIRVNRDQEQFGFYDFTIDADALPGDSGSPIIMWDGGKPVVIGLTFGVEAGGRFSYKMVSGWTYGVRLDWLKELLG